MNIKIRVLLSILFFPLCALADSEILPSGLVSGGQSFIGNSISMVDALEADTGPSQSMNGQMTLYSGFVGQLSFSQSVNTAPSVDPDIQVLITGFQAELTASFTDPDTPDTHTAAIDWGDGFTFPGSVTQGTGGGTVSGNHTYADNGIYTITVTVFDSAGYSGSSATTIHLFSYMVNGDGSGDGDYWPGFGGYFNGWLAVTELYTIIYPAWCADMDTIIRLGVWYHNVGVYTSETSVCSLVNNPDNFDLVNFLLVNYRSGRFIDLGATHNEIQAVIWMLLFNGTPVIGGNGINRGGFISWDQAIAAEIYDYVTTNGPSNPPDYTKYPVLPITIVIDCGDQVNLLEIPYSIYLDLLDLGIIGACP